MSIAKRVIKKCGGVEATASLVGRNANAIRKWTYDKNKGGTGGIVPLMAQQELVRAGREGLCDVTPDDFFPQASDEQAAS